VARKTWGGDKDGNASLPQGPGLGVEVDEFMFEKVNADPTWKSTPKPRSRWLQYRLRTLMVLGCGLGWFGREVQRVRAQREAAGAIEKLGGGI